MNSSAKEKVEFHPSNPIPFLDQFRYLSRDLRGVNSLKLWQISRVCRRFFSLLVHPIHLSAIYLYTRPRSFHYRGRSGAADVKISFNVSTSDGPIFPHFLWKIRAPFRGWSAIDSIASCRRKKKSLFSFFVEEEIVVRVRWKLNRKDVSFFSLSLFLSGLKNQVTSSRRKTQVWRIIAYVNFMIGRKIQFLEGSKRERGRKRRNLNLN